MKKGYTYSDIAVYLPTEDSWIAGIMPKEKQFIWAWGYYEIRYVYFPDELAGYNPVWINYEFLNKATVVNNHLKIGNVDVGFLYIDAKYLDFKVLKRLVELANDGLKIIMKQKPQEASAVKNNNYGKLVETLCASKNFLSSIPFFYKPFLECDDVPVHLVRKVKNELYLFFPNPKSYRLKFPLEYGQSLCQDTIKRFITINYNNKRYHMYITFHPYESLLYKLDKDKIEQVDIKFVPKTPVVKKREDDYIAPWLVK